MTFQYVSSDNPRESCSYSLSTDDFKHIRKHFRRPLTYLQALSPVLILLLVTFTRINVADKYALIIVAANIAAYIVYKIRWTKLFNSLAGAVYSLNVYNDHFTLTVDKILAEKQAYKVNFVSITQIVNAGSCLIIVTPLGNYYVKKEVLTQNSAIYEAATTLGRKYSSKPMPPRIKNAALVFAILSIAAFIGAVFVYGYILAAENKIYLVFILLMLIFPIITAIYLLILKFKGYYVIKHFVISCVSAALILVVAVFTGLTRLPFQLNTTAPITSAEEYFNIDIPEYEIMGTYPKNILWPFDRSHYLSVVRFYSDDFRESVYSNSNWLPNPPEALEDIAVHVNYTRYYYADADYVMLYNMDTGELNTRPSESGTYHFIAVYFEMYSRDDTLYIVEYDVEYTK